MTCLLPRVTRRTSIPVLGSFMLCLGLAAGAAGQSPSPSSGAAAESPAAASPAAESPAASLSAAPSPTGSLDPTRVTAAAGRLEDMAGTLETDRLLLVELRKKLPQARAEAEAFLANVEQLALTADPARLGVIVSRVRAAAPVYLDWRDQQFATQAEAQDAYLQSGAAAFDADWSTLRDAILLTVANQIDTVLEIVGEMQGGQ